MKKMVEKKWNGMKWFVGLKNWMIWNSMEWNGMGGIFFPNIGNNLGRNINGSKFLITTRLWQNSF